MKQFFVLPPLGWPWEHRSRHGKVLLLQGDSIANVIFTMRPKLSFLTRLCKVGAQGGSYHPSTKTGPKTDWLVSVSGVRWRTRVLCGEFVREKLAGDRSFRDVLARLLRELSISRPFEIKRQRPIFFNPMFRDLLEVSMLTSACILTKGMACGRIVAHVVAVGRGCASDSINRHPFDKIASL